MKILICDNNPIVLKLLEQILHKEGHEIFIAQDGLKASEIIQENRLDIFITEILVPFKSGLELILLAKEKNPHTSTIILSQINADEYIQQAFKIGASDYITKPFNPDMIVTRIKKILITKS